MQIDLEVWWTRYIVTHVGDAGRDRTVEPVFLARHW